MPIPSTIKDLSSNTASNYPLGSDLIGSPATVDDLFRSLEAILRDETLNKSWERRGDTPTYVSGTTFTVPNDKTAYYTGSRRFRSYGTATLYGGIVSSSYNGSVTTVTILGDSSGTLDSSLSEVQLGIDPKAVLAAIFAAGGYLPTTGGEMRGDITMSNNDIIGVKNITSFVEYDNGNSGAAKSIDWSNGQNQKITINSNTTLTIQNPPGVGHYQLRMIMDGTGGYTVALTNIGSGVWLSSASQPAFNTAASGKTVLNFFWDGSGWTASSRKVGAVG
jgi:hypothetical protein